MNFIFVISILLFFYSQEIFAFHNTDLLAIENTGGLNGRITDNGKFYFGNILDTNTISDSVVTSILEAEFGCITPETSMNMDAIQTTKGSFNFANADATVDWAVIRGKCVRGKTLLSHSQLPSWVRNINDATALKEVITVHIATVMEHYKGKIYSWDVVNDVFNDDGTFRASVFYNVLGEEFIDIAFNAARAADPDAKLYISDYGLDTFKSPKIAAMVSNVKKWKSAGIPIDGIGSQAHLQAGMGSQVEDALWELSSAGTDVALTELDIIGASKQDYFDAVRGCLSVAECVGITVWGVKDSGANTLMYDAKGNQKTAYVGAWEAMKSV